MRELEHRLLESTDRQPQGKAIWQASGLTWGPSPRFGCSGYIRLDIRYDEKEKKIYVLEINPNPDISEEGGLAREAKMGGLSYKDLILKIIDLALKRENQIKNKDN